MTMVVGTMPVSATAEMTSTMIRDRVPTMISHGGVLYIGAFRCTPWPIVETVSWGERVDRLFLA